MSDVGDTRSRVLFEDVVADVGEDGVEEGISARSADGDSGLSIKRAGDGFRVNSFPRVGPYD